MRRALRFAADGLGIDRTALDALLRRRDPVGHLLRVEDGLLHQASNVRLVRLARQPVVFLRLELIGAENLPFWSEGQVGVDADVSMETPARKLELERNAVCENGTIPL